MKAVFFDRDGTINFDKNGYISNPDDFELFPFVIPALKILKKNNFELFLVTNQSGIARGFFDFKHLDKIHSKLEIKLSEKDLYIKEILVSPYHKDGIVSPYNVEHNSRKPKRALLDYAEKKYKIIKKKSFMIGDKLSDIEFGIKGGLTSILVKTGNGEKTWKEIINKNCIKPDYVVSNFMVAVKLIEQISKK